ncbi:MAG TPA: toxin-antitoxin system protein [Blastocatellia bacterium]|nr:toxin-antitoxin system protein [Blastocatellia bacterium]
MSSSTVRVSDKSREDLREISNQTGESMAEVLAKAIEAYRRTVFMDQFNAAYAVVRSDEQDWRREQDERLLWDATLGDGLEDY